MDGILDRLEAELWVPASKTSQGQPLRIRQGWLRSGARRDDDAVAVGVGELGHALAPRLVGRVGEHGDAVGAEVLDGSVAVVGVDPQRESVSAGGGGVGADAEVGVPMWT